MRFGFTCLALAIGISGMSLFDGARAEDERISIKKLPKVVKQAVRKRFPGARLRSAEKETEDGKTVYDVTIRHREQKFEVAVTPEGKIVSFEKEISAKRMPRVVQQTLEAKYPNATPKRVEEVYAVNDGAEKLEAYEVLLMTAAEKTFEVLITPEGKITKAGAETQPKGEKK